MRLGLFAAIVIGRVAPATLAGIVAGACFSGADALGLPCREDLDCGLDQRCTDGFCGGPQTGPESTSTDATTTSTSSESSSDTGIAECSAQPGDANFCMPVDPGTDDALCNFDCTAVLCGDGHVNEDAAEECELAVAGTPTCTCDDHDCSMASCGDMHTNAVAGEDCDDGNDEDYDACSAACRTNVFADALELRGGWTVESSGLPDGWVFEAGQWWSGDYDILDQVTDPGRAVPGVTRLVSPPIVVPAAGDDPLVLSFRHLYDFDPYCDETELSQADGGRVELWIDGTAIEWPAARSIYPDTLVDACEGFADPNPLGAVPAFAGVATEPADVAIELPAAAYGETVQIVFAAGFDCGLCDADDEPDGWRIEAVRVGPNAAGGCAS